MLFSLITLDLSRATKNFLLRTLLMRRGPRDMETNRKRNKRITETNRRKNQVCSFSRLNQIYSLFFSSRLWKGNNWRCRSKTAHAGDFLKHVVTQVMLNIRKMNSIYLRKKYFVTSSTESMTRWSSELWTMLLYQDALNKGLAKVYYEEFIQKNNYVDYYDYYENYPDYYYDYPEYYI